MTVDKVYNILKFIVRKNQLGSLPPSEFEYAFNTAQRNYYDFLVGRIEQYQYGRPIPRVGLAMTDNVMSRLLPFKYIGDLAITPVSGLAIKPLGVNKIITIYNANKYRVYRLEEDRLAERLHDSIDPISEKNAFYIEDKNFITVYPENLLYCRMHYLKVPVDVVWGYTIDSQGRPVYNPGTSVQPEWLENDYDEIIARAAKIIGVSLKEPIDIQYGQQVIQTGE